jgi:hypothetical protein
VTESTDQKGGNLPREEGQPSKAKATTSAPRTEDAGPEEVEEQEPDVTKDAGELGADARRIEREAINRIFFAGRTDARDIVAGDQTINLFTGAWRTSESSDGHVELAMGRDLLRERTAGYVQPGMYAAARHILQEHHVLVLHGRAHWGKRVTALHLLNELAGDDVRMVSPDEEISTLSQVNLTQGCGYFVHNLAPTPARRLSLFQVNLLSEKLRKARAFYVATVDSRVPLTGLPDSHTVSCEEPPDARQVLLALLGNLAVEQAKVEELLAEERLLEFLGTGPCPPQVGRLAELLVQVARGDVDLDEALGGLQEQVHKDIEEWFSQHADRRDRAFMVSLGVYDGAAYQDALFAADRLDGLIESIEEPDGPTGRTIFSPRTAEHLAEVGARIQRVEKEASLGPMPVEVVEFKNPLYASSLLDVLWDQHGYARGPVLSWLKSLAVDRHLEVRIRASLAIGFLSTHGFGYIQEEVLSDWSQAEDYRKRQAVAWMLAIPALDPMLAPVVRELLRSWSDPESSRWRRLTAAGAYGAQVGMEFPDAALRGLRQIAANDDDEMIRTVVSYSVGNLFDGHQDRVLDALLDWTAQHPEADRQTHGLPLLATGIECFLLIAKDATVVPPPEGEGWPYLLAITDDSAQQVRVTTLLRRALGTPDTVEGALGVLWTWVEQADADRRLLDLLCPVVDSLADRERDRQRLCFHLQRWTDDPDKHSQAAAELLAHLDHRGYGNGERTK